ncbi:MAG: alpha/beta fold hydrolase [Patescibacteria group bacterium]
MKEPALKELTLGIRGTRIVVKTAGPKNGIPVLLLHGAWGTCLDHMQPLIEPLVQLGYRVICPDMRGYGKSQPRTRVFTTKSSYRNYFFQDAADMAHVVKKVSPSKPVLVMGYSDGGEIGLIMTALYPELVRGSLLWATSGKITKGLIDSFVAQIPALSDPLWEHPKNEDQQGWADWKDTLVARHGEESFETGVKSYVPAVYSIYAKGGQLLSDTELSKIQRHVYLVTIEGDVDNPVADVEALIGKIPTYQNGAGPRQWANVTNYQDVENAHSPQKDPKGLIMLVHDLKQLAELTAK